MSRAYREGVTMIGIDRLRRRFSAVLVICATLGLAACAQDMALPDEEAPKTAANPSESYRLEPGNRVRVTVFGENNLSGDFVIDPFGNIALPLAVSVPAAGITAPTLSTRIEDALKRSNFLREPRVNVEVMTFRPFYVMGEVRGPGEFQYQSGMTVLSAIARAGGYDYRARQGDVILIRTISGGQREYRANEMTPILPGDIIRVRERRF